MPGKVPTYLQIIFSQIGFQIECQEKKHPKIICQIAAVPEEYLPHNMSDRMPTRISDKASVCMEGKTSE
jgi:hypothetical protein